MLISSCTLLSRGIVSLLIMLNYTDIKKVCKDIFGSKDEVADYMAI